MCDRETNTGRGSTHDGWWTAALFVLVCWFAVPPAHADEPAKITFEAQVVPILKERCWKCHAGAEPQQGLRLTSRRDILRGGASGPAIRIAAAESSLLWEKIASNEMPAEGPPLSAAEKGVLRSWINAGAVSAEEMDSETADRNVEAAEAADFWSFRPPVRPRLPDSDESAINPIDAFVVAALKSQGLSLSPEAGRETLLRRSHFDLLGLAPSPAEVQEFCTDDHPLAYEHWLERLLASPHYGERWGRHWLDLAGYADSAGILAEDRPLPNAFRYRDYVIRAFNADKPYDRFLQEQLAGDELSDYWTAHDSREHLPEDVVEAITATGFLRCAADSSRPDFATIKNAHALYFYPTLNDTLQIVASSTLGLTLQCARCHSHKYDPIPQADYYRLQAVFMAAYRPGQWIPQMERQLAVATASQKKAAAEHNSKLDAEITRWKQELAAQRDQAKAKLFDERLAGLPEAIRQDVRAALLRKAEERNAVEAYLVEKLQPLLQPDDATLENVLTETYADYRQATEKCKAEIAAQERQRVQFEEIRALYDLPGAAPTPLLRRGDPLTPGPLVEPGVLTALQAPRPFSWTPPAADAKTSGRRLAFAQWLTQPAHPLTARVLVNRIWLHHFGEGLVSTPEDFGALGAPPSHPQLLDWLACELVDSGWSIKHLHRLIMTSRVYRQQSTYDASRHAAALEVDPDNRLLWRQRMRRLEAEALRDAVLQASGLLDRSLFGSPVAVARRADGEVNVADGGNDRRRSVYLQILRLNPLTLLQAFDQPVMETNCTRRGRSTVSTQALTLLNSDFMLAGAQALAERVLREFADSPVAGATLIAFSRPATAEETAQLTQFVDSQQAQYAALGSEPAAARRQALADLCHMLLSANEFVYVD